MNCKFLMFLTFLGCLNIALTAQTTIKGEVRDRLTGEELIGANIVEKNTQNGTVTDWDGTFEIKLTNDLPTSLEISYLGYITQVVEVTNKERLKIKLEEDVITTQVVEVKGQRISDKQKSGPLTLETLDVLAIKETASTSFYEGLGNLKGVDLTSASLGFKVINTRGFNSTSPVRSLQIIDGVDNQAPGLNFSLGNFLGSSELDVLKVDIIQGASSAFYGPNAFNGVISMETKNPFLQKGLSAQLKYGERNLVDVSARWAEALKNKDGKEWMAYKINFAYLRADDWEARDFSAVFDTNTGVDNPGRYDAVNIYGDEYNISMDLRTSAPWEFVGLDQFHRQGYKEEDLVDYDTRNIKANVAFHFRTNPDKEYESPELIVSSSFGNGTTVYQGDNRFSLRNILFFQNRLEFRKKDKFFLRAYATHEDAGDSYDPYFTAIQLQERTITSGQWASNYIRFWQNNYSNSGARANQLGYPRVESSIDPITGEFSFSFDNDAASNWLQNFNDSLFNWHQLALQEANQPIPGQENSAFLAPGTPEFEAAFKEITETASSNKTEGTKFFDKSALYHLHGEYTFTPEWAKTLRVGANARYYTPKSNGSIFSDSTSAITNYEFGIYSGIEKKFFDDQLIASATVRMDKNQNFDFLLSPAASLVFQKKNTFIRASFSSAIRNPTLSDQYLSLNVGRAILSGNLNGVDSVYTIESFQKYNRTRVLSNLEFFSIPAIKPEKVKTFELGIRTTLFEKLYVDASYYYNIYDDFIGVNFAIDASFDNTGMLQSFQAYRYSANSTNQVTTQGASLGLNYYFGKHYQLNGNYSWNTLNSDIDDPIIPAFNTPEHKFNLGISGRGIPINFLGDFSREIGFSINYKWVESFIFEGSPQFTGLIPSYDLLDTQVSFDLKKINTILKLGASNLLNNLHIETYGGPDIGRLAYISLLYELKN